jgi:hypothetical protein
MIKKKLIAEGKLDKHGKPNEATPKEYLRSLPDLVAANQGKPAAAAAATPVKAADSDKEMEEATPAKSEGGSRTAVMDCWQLLPDCISTLLLAVRVAVHWVAVHWVAVHWVANRAVYISSQSAAPISCSMQRSSEQAANPADLPAPLPLLPPLQTARRRRRRRRTRARRRRRTRGRGRQQRRRRAPRRTR